MACQDASRAAGLARWYAAALLAAAPAEAGPRRVQAPARRRGAPMTTGQQPGAAREQAKLLLRALAAGLVGGASALVLRFVISELPRLVWPHAADLVQAVALEDPLRRVLVPVLGAALAGAILTLGVRWSRTAKGWDVLEAVVLRNGILPLRSTLVRVASAIVSQAAAAPIGKEGPIVLL